MDDAWSFPTERGRVRVAGGRLRVEKSARGLVRSTHYRQWRRASWAGRALFAGSVAATAGSLWRVVSALAALVTSGSLSVGHWILVAGFAVAGLAVARKVVGGRHVPLEAVESVERDGRSFEVAVADGEGDDVEFEALTEAAADEAARALRLKGAAVDGERANGKEKTPASARRS